MSHRTICLNCDHPTTGKFCADCGQRTDTHRITFKHFIFHDIMHGMWHFEKGILFTVKQAMLRPGKAALEYISGKRIRYYNVFYLTLLLIGLNIFVTHIQTVMSHKYFGTRLEPETNDFGRSIDTFLNDNAKLLIFSFIPLFAINSFLIFRRKKLNFSEHFIISGMMFLGVMIIVTVTTLFYFTDFTEHFGFISTIVNIATPISIIIFLAVNYYETFSENYTKFQTSLRAFLFITMLLLEIMLLLIVMVGYFTKWTYNLKIVYG